MFRIERPSSFSTRYKWDGLLRIDNCIETCYYWTFILLATGAKRLRWKAQSRAITSWRWGHLNGRSSHQSSTSRHLASTTGTTLRSLSPVARSVSPPLRKGIRINTESTYRFLLLLLCLPFQRKKDYSWTQLLVNYLKVYNFFEGRKAKIGIVASLLVQVYVFTNCFSKANSKQAWRRDNLSKYRALSNLFDVVKYCLH